MTAAKSVRGELSNVSWSPPSTLTLEAIFKEYFENPLLRIPNIADLFSFFEDALDAVLALSVFTQQRLNEGYGGFPEGEWWNIWIIKLTEIARNHDLPYKVRNDTDKQKPASPSPFAAFVYEFQKHLPENVRKSVHSVDAAAQAINRARRLKWTPLMGPLDALFE